MVVKLNQKMVFSVGKAMTIKLLSYQFELLQYSIKIYNQNKQIYVPYRGWLAGKYSTKCLWKPFLSSGVTTMEQVERLPQGAQQK